MKGISVEECDERLKKLGCVGEMLNDPRCTSRANQNVATATTYWGRQRNVSIEARYSFEYEGACAKDDGEAIARQRLVEALEQIAGVK
jgi:hypothetical protein